MTKQGKLYWMKERLKTWVLFVLSLLFVVAVSGVSGVWAEDCTQLESNSGVYLECLGREIGKLSEDLQASRNATAPLEEELNSLIKKISGFQYQIDQAKVRQVEIGAEIEEREDLLSEQYLILAEKTREYYKRLRSTSFLSQLLSSMGTGETTREMAYRNEANERDRQIILQLSGEIGNLERDKIELEEQKEILAGLQAVLNKEADFYGGEVAKAKDYQSVLSGQIASLTAKQQAIVAARSGSFITSVGSVPIGSDYDASIAGFESGAPSGYFAVFSFGAYTHRKGMSQYGAKARAEDKQLYEQILQAYYPGSNLNKEYSEPSTIHVVGEGTSCFKQVDNTYNKYYDENVDFQTYLRRIYEIPSSWHKEAQKAQAVAARTYAIKQINNKGYIRPSQADQMYKDCDKGGDWAVAVQETERDVLLDGGGQPVTTYYSSTSGGYLTTMGWDTTDGSAGGDWTSKAWESKAGSPWFYKAWYRQSYRNDSSDCGRRPWMSEEEMADILNAGLILKKGEGSGVDTGRVLPVTIGSCPIGGQSGDPYSMGDLRSKLSNPVTSISGDAVVTNDGGGNTSQVKFQTNRGEVSFSGAEFKSVINTRAPGYISIPQSSFAFFNIERK